MTRVTEDGLVTIPASIREELGLQPGDDVTFVETDQGYVIRKAVDDSPFETWQGLADTNDTVDERLAELRDR